MKSSAPVYITFDVDCLELPFASGTGTPVVGGLSKAQALPILNSLGDLDLIGMDIVEVAPAYEHAGIMALEVATIGHDYLYLLVQKRGLGNLHQKLCLLDHLISQYYV